MASAITVPDIGDFEEVEVIELLVRVGDRVDVEQPLITLESDKATMDIPAPAAGVISTLSVQLGDRVSEGTVIATLEALDTPDGNRTEGARLEAGSGQAPEPSGTPAVKPGIGAKGDVHAEVVVLGAGPGGYTAAFRAADLGKRTVLIERYPSLGGVCLNVGCIPSKALLHTAGVIRAVEAMASHGVSYTERHIDLGKLAAWKDSVVGQLTKGLSGLAKQRKVQVVHGTGRFSSPHLITVEGPDGTTQISFDQAIVAAGSQATKIPSFPNLDPRVMDSTDALGLEEIPKRMLVIGGGIIGLEMAAVYSALGTRITVVELLDGLMPGCDRDLVRPLERRIRQHYEAIYLGTKVISVEAGDQGLKVGFAGAKAPESDTFDRVLVAVGRRPNGHQIGAEAAGVRVNDGGYIPVDKQQRTNVPHIFAIGDIVGQPMLAHKATHEGKVAAETVAGHKVSFDPLAIPNVAYTDPEVAWTGLTESDAKARGIEYEKASFPWAASGRSLGMGRNEGMTKLLFDPESGRVVGAGVVGPHAGDLIAEANLALEMGADAQDLALTIHPHPTLSETLNFAAEVMEGTVTDIYVPQKSAKKAPGKPSAKA